MTTATSTTKKWQNGDGSPIVELGMMTPWGKADMAREFIEGVGIVSTSSHGGYKLSAARNEQVLAVGRRANGWYEEDCDWCVPWVTFKDEMIDGWDAEKAKLDATHDSLTGETIWLDAVRCCMNWLPELFELLTGRNLEPGQSHKRDEALFFAKHAQDWIGVTVSDDYKADGRTRTPFYIVTAMMGGRDSGNTTKMRFRVPRDEYEARGPFGFVIDTRLHAVAHASAVKLHDDEPVIPAPAKDVAAAEAAIRQRERDGSEDAPAS